MNSIEVMFCSQVIIKCRDAVRYSRSTAVLSEDEKLIGIVYEIDGRYRKYYLEKGLENLANFICSSDKDKLILGVDDYAIFNTMGKYIDFVIKGVELKPLLEYLVKYQKSTTKFRCEN